jgi:hypothetical protein
MKMMGHTKYPSLSSFYLLISLSSISLIGKEWGERELDTYIQCILLFGMFAPKSSKKDSASFTVGNSTMEMNHQPAVASNIHRKDGVISPSKDFLFSCCANPYTQIEWQFIEIVYDYYTYGKGHATWFLPSSYAQSHSMTLTSHFSSFAFTGKK